jgi:hypothetical protein
MKKIVGLSVFAIAMGCAIHVQAQKDTTLKHVGHEIKKGAEKVGDKTKEIASKGRAKVTDHVYKDKVAPNGETVYIDKHDRYYWIDKEGHHHYLKKSELRNKS